MRKFDTTLSFYRNSHSKLVRGECGGQAFFFWGGALGADLLLIDLRERKAPAPPPKNRLQAAVGRILTKEDIQVDGDPESPSKAKSGERQSKSHSPWKTKADFYDSYQDQEEEARKAFVKASWKEFERTCKLFVGEQSKCKCEPGRWL